MTLLATLRAQATVPVGEFHTWPPPLGTMSPTVETADLLYALIRHERPGLVIESGTGLGVSARFIAEALPDGGRLVTFEPKAEYREGAAVLITGLPVDSRSGDSRDWDGEQPDIVYLDSDVRRAQEVAYWRGRGPMIIIHDGNRRYTDGGMLFPGGSDGLWIGY